MNSALQLILSCTGLCEAILESESEGEVITIFRELIKHYRKAKKAFSPGAIKQVVGEKSSTSKGYGDFVGFGQQDAHEFVARVIDLIEKELQNDNKKDSTVADLMNSKIRIVVKSRESDKKSCHHQDETILPLDLPNNNRAVTLKDCVLGFSKVEELDAIHNFDVLDEDGNKVKDDKGRVRQVSEKAYKQTIIENTSKYIIMHIKRFQQMSMTHYRKKNNDVIVPEKMNTSKGVYVLKSFIVQSGSLRGGHYVAFVNDDGKWFCANDSNVYPVRHNRTDNIVKGAYMLCYERQ